MARAMTIRRHRQAGVGDYRIADIAGRDMCRIQGRGAPRDGVRRWSFRGHWEMGRSEVREDRERGDTRHQG